MDPLPLPPNSRAALVIVDMQTFFFRDPERRINLEQVVKNINRLSVFFDSRSLPVIHVISAFKADGSNWDLKMKAAGKAEMIENTDEIAILPEVLVRPNHVILTKTRYSAFFKTNLAELLHSQKIDRVVVVGAYTHYCVNATIFDAFCHDFVPCLISDAVLSHLPGEAELMIARMRRNGYHVMTTDEFAANQST
jgi:nicotinamidase-related amidase